MPKSVAGWSKVGKDADPYQLDKYLQFYRTIQC